MSETYVEHLPRAELSEVVRTVWVQRTGRSAYLQRHLPTGGVEIQVPLGGAPRLIGPLTGPRIEAIPAGTTLVGVRFHPRMAPPTPTALQDLVDAMGAHLSNRGLLELFTTIAAEASNPGHPAHAFIQTRYAENLATLATHLQEAVDAGAIAPMSPTEIDIEVRLVTAVLDGIGLQWLLDPATDVVASTSTYIARTIAGWRAGSASGAA